MLRGNCDGSSRSSPLLLPSFKLPVGAQRALQVIENMSHFTIARHRRIGLCAHTVACSNVSFSQPCVVHFFQSTTLAVTQAIHFLTPDSRRRTFHAPRPMASVNVVRHKEIVMIIELGRATEATKGKSAIQSEPQPFPLNKRL